MIWTALHLIEFSNKNLDVPSDALLLWSILNKPPWECLDVLTTLQYPQYTAKQHYNIECSEEHKWKQDDCNALLYITVLSAISNEGIICIPRFVLNHVHSLSSVCVMYVILADDDQ